MLSVLFSSSMHETLSRRLAVGWVCFDNRPERMMLIMRVVEAVWEKRNLGVTCIEMEIGKQDAVPDIEQVISERTEQYQVAKVSAGNVAAVFALQKHGFQFIETLFQTEISLEKRPEPPELYRKLQLDAGYHTASDSEQEAAIAQILRGDIFSTDRVALDPVFSHALSARRNALWAQDALTGKNAAMIITEYRGQNVGFNILADKGSYCDGLLGGLFAEFQNTGTGFANVYSALNAAHDMGAKKMISHVSSNNFQMYKLHLLYGMRVTHMTYNLVKHC